MAAGRIPFKDLSLAARLRGEAFGRFIVFCFHDDVDSLDQAVALLERACDLASAHFPEGMKVRTDLVRYLRYHPGTEHHADRIIELCRSVTASRLPKRAIRAEHAALLADLLCRRFDRTGDVRDLDDAVTASRSATAIAPWYSRVRTQALSATASALVRLFEHHGTQEHLAGAEIALRRAIRRARWQPSVAAALYANLAYLEATKFAAFGRLENLSRAVEASRHARLIAHEPSHRAQAAANLSGALRHRYRHTGEIADLAESLRYAYESLRDSAPDDPQRPNRASGLGNVLRNLYELNGDRRLLSLAIDHLRTAATAAPPGHPDAAGRRSDLANALATRNDSSTDLDEAVRLLTEAVTITGREHPDRPDWLANLANVLVERGQSEDAETAARLAAESVAGTAVDDPDRCRRLTVLGRAWEHTLSGQDTAIDFYRQAAGLHAPPTIRIEAALGVAELEAGRGEWLAATEAYATVLDIVPSLVHHGLTPRSHRQRADQIDKLATTAAAVALSAERPETAVDFLECARTMRWQQSLDRNADLRPLSAAAPALAERLAVVRNALRTLG